MAELNCQMHVKTATDYDDIYLTSKSQLVEYDNTISGLSATDTKSAIDELANPTFTEAVTLANVNSGESGSMLWGKIKKWFNSLEKIAYVESIAESVVGHYGTSILYKKWITTESTITPGGWVVIGTYPLAQYPYLRIDHGQSTFAHPTQNFLYSANSFPAQCGVRYNYTTGDVQAYSATLEMQPVICIYYTKA